jgi:hypothetical protein
MSGFLLFWANSTKLILRRSKMKKMMMTLAILAQATFGESITMLPAQDKNVDGGIVDGKLLMVYKDSRGQLYKTAKEGNSEILGSLITQSICSNPKTANMVNDIGIKILVVIASEDGSIALTINHCPTVSK